MFYLTGKVKYDVTSDIFINRIDYIKKINDG